MHQSATYPRGDGQKRTKSALSLTSRAATRRSSVSMASSDVVGTLLGALGFLGLACVALRRVKSTVSFGYSAGTPGTYRFRGRDYNLLARFLVCFLDHSISCESRVECNVGMVEARTSASSASASAASLAAFSAAFLAACAAFSAACSAALAALRASFSRRFWQCTKHEFN